jgi:DNA-binding MarR family transcriptional regulator
MSLEVYEEKRELLETISERTRFKIVLTLLASPSPLSFSQLLSLLNLNPGTFKAHLDRLMGANLITKETIPAKSRDQPRTFYRLTEKGLKLLEEAGMLKAREDLRSLFTKMTSK